jgi:hypothetical protein
MKKRRNKIIKSSRIPLSLYLSTLLISLTIISSQRITFSNNIKIKLFRTVYKKKNKNWNKALRKKKKQWMTYCFSLKQWISNHQRTKIINWRMTLYSLKINQNKQIYQNQTRKSKKAVRINRNIGVRLVYLRRWVIFRTSLNWDKAKRVEIISKKSIFLRGLAWRHSKRKVKLNCKHRIKCRRSLRIMWLIRTQTIKICKKGYFLLK